MIQKSVLILAFFLFGSIFSSCLANEQSKEIENRVQLMSEGLKLTSEQTTKLREILSNANEKIKNSHDQKDKNNQDNNFAEKEIRDQIDNQIIAILTPEQQDRFKKMLKAKPLDKHLSELKEKLSLTEGQMQSIELIITTNASKIEEIKQSPDSKKDPKYYHLAMKKVMDTQAIQIEKLLTEDQRKAFKEMQKEQEEQMKKDRPEM